MEILGIIMVHEILIDYQKHPWKHSHIHVKCGFEKVIGEYVKKIVFVDLINIEVTATGLEPRTT